MSNMSEDIQYAGSDTRPPMLDRTDFESWQQRIRLYCLGKDNGENIMKSITEGPFKMGTFIQTPAEETEGALQLGPERARVFTDLSAEEKERYKADIRATNILLQGIPKDIYTLINHYTDAKDIWDNVKMILEGSELTKDDRESQLYDEFEHFPLKKQYDDLLVKLDDTGFKAAKYKRGLTTLEDQIVKYREHEVLFSEEITLLKRSVGHKEYQMGLLRAELEEVKQEKEGVDFKIAKFDKSAKDLDQLLGSQITDNSKKGLGYSAVPPPHPLIINRPNKLDLSYSGLVEFKEPEFKGYGPKNSKKESNVVCENSSNETKKNSDAPLIEEWVSDNEDEVESLVVVKKKTVLPTAAKIEFVRPKQHEKPVRKPVKYAEMYRSQKLRGNQKNWNNLKSQQLGNEFVMNNKACFACGSFNHLIKDCKRKVQKPIWNNARRVNHHNSHRMSYPHPKRNFVPKAVLMKTGMRPVNAAKPKAAYNAVKRNRFNVVKASACWVWMPKNRVVDHVSKNISASVTLKRLDYIDAQGRFKTLKRLDYIDAQGRFKSVMAWMDAQIQVRQECSKEKEESREECSKSKKTKKMNPNVFIPTDLSIKNVKEKVNVPVMLRKLEYSRLYYKPDMTFSTPKAYVKFDFYCPFGGSSPEANVLTEISTSLLMDYLNEYG
ncbi:retrovirus-related pol polyprotein from transposon TNT 1-94 [Tanacetum coccineum]